MNREKNLLFFLLIRLVNILRNMHLCLLVGADYKIQCLGYILKCDHQIKKQYNQKFVKTPQTYLMLSNIFSVKLSFRMLQSMSANEKTRVFVT